MLKQMRKRIQQGQLKEYKQLAKVVCIALALSMTSSATWADTGMQSFSDGRVHTLNDNIITGYISGLYVESGSIAKMNGFSITATGSPGNSMSVGAWASIGSINLTNVSINTSGGTTANYGAFTLDGNITMSDCRITVTGSNFPNANYGAVAAGGGNIELNNIAVQAIGNYTDGVSALTNGTLKMKDGSITTDGLNSHGVYARSGGVITLTNTTLHSEGTAIYADNGIINASVNGQNIVGSTALFEATNGGTIAIEAQKGSQLYGVTILSNGGTANLTLNSNATWTNSGDSTLTNLMLSSGNVWFATPTTGHTLAVNNLAGSSGAIYVNSNINTNSTDSLIINGSASGNHNIYSHIVNLPTNLYQTVPVVQFGGSATNNATFGGGGDIGIYRYGIAPGSALSSAYSILGKVGDYYLYNTFGPSTLVRAAISTGTSINSLWYGEMNDIKKRMGELRMGTQKDSDIWARTYATEYRLSPTGGNDYKQHVNGIEIGKDHPEVYSDGKKFTGMVMGAGHARNSFDEDGSGKADSFYLGAYKSWLNNDGSYFDIIGKYNWFKHNFDSPVLGGGSDSASYHNKGFGLSAEIGKRFDKKDGYFIEPQLELSAFWSNKADYTTENGLNVETDRGRSLQLRAGTVFGKQMNCSNGTKQQIYGKVSWVREFEGDSTLQVNGTTFDSSLKGNQFVAGLGIVTDTPGHQIYVDVEKSWGKTTSKDWGVDLGCRWKF